MSALSIEHIITVSVMCLWFAFPVGMFISVMRQQDDEIKSKIPKDGSPIKGNVVHIRPISVHTYDNDDNDDNDDSVELSNESYTFGKTPRQAKETHSTHHHT